MVHRLAVPVQPCGLTTKQRPNICQRSAWKRSWVEIARVDLLALIPWIASESIIRRLCEEIFVAPEQHYWIASLVMEPEFVLVR